VISDDELEVQPVAGALGAEVCGVDLREPLSEGTLRAIREVLLRHMVMFFPGQFLSPREQRDFARNWGPVSSYPGKTDLADVDVPEVARLAASTGDTADIWHTDGTHRDGAEWIAFLSGVKMPPVGGDTMWSNQCRAYDALSAPMRNLLDGLTAIHDDRLISGKPTQQVERPVVRLHPETGRRCLYVNRLWTHRIVQMPAAESDALLAFLFAHSAEPRFTVRYRWVEGTLVVWDQRCTQHYVVNDFEGERVLHRLGVGGDVVVGVGDSPWERYVSDRVTVGNVLDIADESDRPSRGPDDGAVDAVSTPGRATKGLA
jgi:taurine dioxygenase